ncbi:hypothetical protein D3C81_1970100 [compost metagenome]
MQQAHPLILRVLECQVAAIEQLATRSGIGNAGQFLVEPETAEGIGQQRRRWPATGLHQTQHVVLDRTDFADLLQQFITESSHRRTQPTQQGQARGRAW